MSLIYITGLPGAGKSAALAELKRRGFEAYGLDEDSYGSWLHRSSQERHELPDTDDELDLHEWFATHHWSASIERISELAAHSSDRTVFLCGNASDDDKARHLFDTIFVLQVDDELLQHRLMNRTNNQYGKHPDELNEVMKWHTPEYYHDYEQYGAILVDSTKPIAIVVDTILAHVSDQN